MKIVSSKGKKVQSAKSARNTARPPAKPVSKSSGKSAVKTVLVILMIIIISFALITVSLGFYVRNLDTVFPNVWADGIRLAGMTLEEASQTLIEQGYESNAEDVSATVVFSDGESFTIFGDEAGFSLDAREAAAAAFEFGRGEPFPQSELTFIRSLFRRTDLREVSMSGFNEEHVRGVVSENTARFNKALFDGGTSIGDDSIVIVKGAGFEPAYENDVFELTVETLHRALAEQAHLSSEFHTNSTDSAEIDLDMLYEIISEESVSAEYDPQTLGATQSRSGVSFDMDAARAMVLGASNGEEIIIPLVHIEPEMTTEELEGMLFRDLISTSTTTISGTNARYTNVVLAAEEIDGTILNPGDVFSFNQVVGRRTADRGFKMAGGFQGGRLVDMLGGGVCQMSSTMYDAVLRTSLEVVERRNHGLTVAYLPFGHDAAISYGSIDFKFKNSFDLPIRIDTIIDGRSLTVNYFGTRPDDITIKTEFNVISSTPFEVIHQEDENVPQGQTVVETPGYRGYVVEVFQLFYDENENLIERVRVSRDTYNVQHRLILIPVEQIPEETPAAEPPDNDPPPEQPPQQPPPEPPPPDEPPPNEPPDEPPDQSHEPPDDDQP